MDTRYGAEAREPDVRGWSIKEMCTPISEEDRARGEKTGEEKAAEEWSRRVGERPTLDDNSTESEIESEAAWIRVQLGVTPIISAFFPLGIQERYSGRGGALVAAASEKGVVHWSLPKQE
jgi:hypothetical protein